MGYLVWFVAGVLAVFGAPLLAVGLILRLCEGSWGKSAGSMGSRGMLTVGGVLCLPAGLPLLAWLLSTLWAEIAR